MKLKNQFFILSFLIISIPILCSIFVLIHTYLHSPNRYLMQGSEEIQKIYYSNIPEEDIINLKKSLKLLPANVEAILLQISTRKVLYSTMSEIEAGRYMQKGEVWNFAADTSETYFYQFTQIPSKKSDTLLITRVPQKKVATEKKTKTILKVLLAVILITFLSLAFIIFISRNIFHWLKKIENSSRQLAEGKLDTPIEASITPIQENEFSNIMHSLETMRCELLEMQASKNRFIMGISHDLRTPVSVIKGYSEAIMDGVISEKNEIKKSMELMEQKTEQLESMIDTLINFMKLNNFEIKEKLVENSITGLIMDFVKYAEVTGKVFKRNVHTDINLPREIKLPLNEQLIHRSFENLLSNAIRYTKENDLIEIKSYLKQEGETENIILEIRDTGTGIDKKDLDHIFDIFYRGTNSRQEEGMGVGLTVVKSIMETHGWNITVESQKNKGSCFTVTIPLK